MPTYLLCIDLINKKVYSNCTLLNESTFSLLDEMLQIKAVR